MWYAPEIEIVPLVEDIWWDMDNDREFTSAMTGTPWQPLPTMERRRVTRPYGRHVHKGCGGDLEVARIDNCVKGFTMKCLKCGEEFCANA